MYWNWNSNHMNGWGWLAMSLSMVLFWALLIAVGVLLFRALSRGSADTHTRASRTTPEQLLAERFARGSSTRTSTGADWPSCGRTVPTGPSTRPDLHGTLNSEGEVLQAPAGGEFVTDAALRGSAVRPADAERVHHVPGVNCDERAMLDPTERARSLDPRPHRA